MTELLWHALIASTCLPGAGLAAAWLSRRASADVRHRLLSGSMLALLLLPAMLAALPAWRVAILPAAESPAARAVDSSAASVPTWLYLVWLLGALTGLAHLAAGWLSLHVARRRAAAPADPAWNALATRLGRRLGLRRTVALRVDARTTTPMTFGTLRPVVALPRCADSWSQGTRETVLAHELAHVVRRDALVALLAQVAGAWYWFQPLVWVLRRQLRLEQEIASDDLVLAAGGKPSAYAGHLLQLARHRRRGSRLDAAVALIGRRSQLERRLLSVLAPSAARGRSRPALAWALAVVLAAGAASVRLERAPPPRSAAKPAPAVARHRAAPATLPVEEPVPARPEEARSLSRPPPPRRPAHVEARAFLYTSVHQSSSSVFATASARASAAAERSRR